MIKRKPVRTKATNRKRGQLLADAMRILDQFRDYWPMTLRQVYYQLVAAGLCDNRLSEYTMLSTNLSKARMAGLVPWEAIEDRTRLFQSAQGWRNRAHFVEDELDKFLSGYRRDLLQTQDAVPEIWVEKDALSSLCYRVSEAYGVGVAAARGFSSTSFLNETRNRIAARRQRTLFLYFGDLDPAGVAMLPSMMTKLQVGLGLERKVDAIRCALNPLQVEQFNLLTNPDALKRADPNYKRYVAEYGTTAYELDALPPAILEDLVRSSIEGNLDLGRLEREREQSATELKDIQTLRARVRQFVDPDAHRGR